MKYFHNKAELIPLIEDYFSKTIDTSTSNPSTHPTLSGLATHLGFRSMDEFDLYESKGYLKNYLKMARLKIIAYYESRLLLPSPTGAMFALKSMGWDGKADKIENVTSIKINLIETGPKPASSEKQIRIENPNLKTDE
ncbi:MAG: hypothetical protein V4619_00370 [Bacteroidota bacterium]